MLLSKPTQHGAGILLYGDYYDLRSVHETISSLSDGIPLEERCENLALGLAYDIRHAYEGRSEVVPIGFDGWDKLTYLGARILWPTFLMQLGMLRWAASFHPTTREEQADLFRLESCTENALLSFDAEAGKEAFEWLKSFPGLPQTYLTEVVNEASARFVTFSTKGKIRFKNLPQLLKMLDPMSQEYMEFERYLQDEAKKKNCNPSDLVSLGELPDFKW